MAAGVLVADVSDHCPYVSDNACPASHSAASLGRVAPDVVLVRASLHSLSLGNNASADSLGRIVAAVVVVQA
jgi:hypothetical protein